MDLAWLEDFLELARALNFSRAAALRNVTQPAFSRRIKALEAAVGTPLVQRTSRSVALTPAGAAFHPRAVALVRLHAEARQAALDAAGAERATLTLAATHALSFTFVPRWLMQVSGPAVIGALSLVSDSQQQCESLMQRGEASFFVCHAHAAVPGLPERQFTARTVGEDRLVPLCAPGADGAPRWRLGEAPVPHLAYGAASGLSRILQAHWSATASPALVPAMSSLLAATNLEMAKEGQGVAWLPLSLAADDLAAGRLVRAGVAQDEVAVQIRLYRPRSRLSPHAERFWQAATG